MIDRATLLLKVQAGALPLLVDLIQSEPTATEAITAAAGRAQERVVDVLYRLAENPSLKPAIVAAAALPALIKMLEGTPLCQDIAAATLRQLAQDHGEIQTAVAAAGAVSAP